MLAQYRLNARTSDDDQDGIDDALEQELAENNYPLIHYSTADPCLAPTPRPVVFRARHPSVGGVVHSDYILINYSQLYIEDCGTEYHYGDNEAFEVFLKWNGTQYQFDSISATAHWDAPCEQWTASYSDELWVGDNKHGTYTHSGCGGCWYVWWEDNCQASGPTISHALFNVGEPEHHLLESFESVSEAFTPSSVWGTIWGEDHFAGAGVVRNQFYNDRFYTLTPPPEETQCYSDCYDAYQECRYYSWDSRCDDEFNSCNSYCSQTTRYWDR